MTRLDQLETSQDAAVRKMRQKRATPKERIASTLKKFDEIYQVNSSNGGKNLVLYALMIQVPSMLGELFTAARAARCVATGKPVPRKKLSGDAAVQMIRDKNAAMFKEACEHHGYAAIAVTAGKNSHIPKAWILAAVAPIDAEESEEETFGSIEEMFGAELGF